MSDQLNLPAELTGWRINLVVGAICVMVYGALLGLFAGVGYLAWLAGHHIFMGGK